MQRSLETAYGLGRLAFGAGLIVAPGEIGTLLLDERTREPAPRIALRSYGTRDVTLGLGTLGALAKGADTRPWLAAGVMSDLLDVGVQLGEWSELPRGKRVAGVLSALGAAAVGAALLARQD